MNVTLTEQQVHLIVDTLNESNQLEREAQKNLDKDDVPFSNELIRLRSEVCTLLEPVRSPLMNY